MTERLIWRGKLPEGCDLCKTKLINLAEFVDGATVMGPWAIMCQDCFERYGRGLGTGAGQVYAKFMIHGKIEWVKTRG